MPSAPEFEWRIRRGAADPVEERTSLDEEHPLSPFSLFEDVVGEWVTSILPRSSSDLEAMVSDKGREEQRPRA